MLNGTLELVYFDNAEVACVTALTSVPDESGYRSRNFSLGCLASNLDRSQRRLIRQTVSPPLAGLLSVVAAVKTSGQGIVQPSYHDQLEKETMSPCHNQWDYDRPHSISKPFVSLRSDSAQSLERSSCKRHAFSLEMKQFVKMSEEWQEIGGNHFEWPL